MCAAYQRIQAARHAPQPQKVALALSGGSNQAQANGMLGVVEMCVDGLRTSRRLCIMEPPPKLRRCLYALVGRS